MDSTSRAKKKAENDLYFLKHKITELGDWCSYDSPEIGHSVDYILGQQLYPQGISNFRDDLKQGKLTWDCLLDNHHKRNVVADFLDNKKGDGCDKCGFYEASHYKASLEWDESVYPCKEFKPPAKAT